MQATRCESLRTAWADQASAIELGQPCPTSGALHKLSMSHPASRHVACRSSKAHVQPQVPGPLARAAAININNTVKQPCRSSIHEEHTHADMSVHVGEQSHDTPQATVWSYNASCQRTPPPPPAPPSQSNPRHGKTDLPSLVGLLSTKVLAGNTTTHVSVAAKPATAVDAAALRWQGASGIAGRQHRSTHMHTRTQPGVCLLQKHTTHVKQKNTCREDLAAAIKVNRNQYNPTVCCAIQLHTRQQASAMVKPPHVPPSPGHPTLAEGLPHPPPTRRVSHDHVAHHHRIAAYGSRPLPHIHRLGFQRQKP